jgi:hypothetical protein
MRIAITGTHGVGKTKPTDDFVDVHPVYRSVQEPYRDLVERGVPFSDVPSVEECLARLEYSVATTSSMAPELGRAVFEGLGEPPPGPTPPATPARAASGRRR